MKTIPVSHPANVKTTSANPSAQAEAKARAIAKLTGGQQAQTQSIPVPNASNIQPEEMGAIRSNIAVSEEEGQLDSNVATNVEETAKVEPKAEEVKLDQQYQILARKERQLRQKAQEQEKQLKAREDQLRLKEEEIKAKEEEYRTNYVPKSKLKANPFGALRDDAGLTDDELAQKQLDYINPVDPRIQMLIEQQQETINKLLQAQEDAKKQQTEAQDNQYKSAVEQIRKDVTSLVKADDTFEMVKLTGSINDVVELIEKTWNEEERLLTIEEAAQEVEDYLVEETLKLSKSKKIMGQSQKSIAQDDANKQTPENKQPQQMRTLTNQTSSARKLSPKERAILAFKGELK